jgi:hypothetical protein
MIYRRVVLLVVMNNAPDNTTDTVQKSVPTPFLAIRHQKYIYLLNYILHHHSNSYYILKIIKK